MRLGLAMLALGGCLASPPSSTGGPPGEDGAPPPTRVEVLGTFSRDRFSYDLPTDDLVAAIAFEGRFYVLHLPATDGGLTAALDAAEVEQLPFEPVALVGADVDGDQQIDVVAAGADGQLSVLSNQPEGLTLIDQEIVIDGGAAPQGINDIQAPDLLGDERLFLSGPDGMWKSEMLDGSGTIHLTQLTPVMTGVAPPDSFFAGHDDSSAWYVGLAHGTDVDLWENSGFTVVTATDLIDYQAPSRPLFGAWRRLPGPRVHFFGVDADNAVQWVSQTLPAGGAQESRLIADLADDPIRDLTTTQQPDGYDFITVSVADDGRIGVQVIVGITTPEMELGAKVSIATSVRTDRPVYVRPISVTDIGFAGNEIVVFDRAGHLLCVGFDADHGTLSECGTEVLDDHIDGWLEAAG